jgi:hypothetical protein
VARLELFQNKSSGFKRQTQGNPVQTAYCCLRYQDTTRQIDSPLLKGHRLYSKGNKIVLTSVLILEHRGRLRQRRKRVLEVLRALSKLAIATLGTPLHYTVQGTGMAMKSKRHIENAKQATDTCS